MAPRAVAAELGEHRGVKALLAPAGWRDCPCCRGSVRGLSRSARSVLSRGDEWAWEHLMELDTHSSSCCPCRSDRFSEVTDEAASFSGGFMLVFQLEIQIHVALNAEFFMLFDVGLTSSYLYD